MYSNEDLNKAVEQGIFTAEAVKTFRDYVEEQRHTRTADEETFRLVTSFNDIFVVIACALLLISSAWVTYRVHPAFSAFTVAGLSWGLSEFFVSRRKMALPAIFLLLIFVSALFTSVVTSLAPSPDSLFNNTPELGTTFSLASLATVIGAWLHWKRFAVPITVAAAAAAGLSFIISLLINFIPGITEYTNLLLLVGGIAIFLFAMRWDAQDLRRVTRKADIAFWLHLAAAPLIVHPIFSSLGVFDGSEGWSNVTIVFGLYVLLTLISLVIDRRAFMVSSLVYVLVALTTLLKTYGFAEDSFAYVGVFIGFSLLLLSGFWHHARSAILSSLPEEIRARVPVVL
ncbi:MAG: hypothetical protein GY792_24760 [Gammaproteobacteria bacterium]|nr:hypothetical protein [Gammaproteobacteria bacterium]